MSKRVQWTTAPSQLKLAIRNAAPGLYWLVTYLYSRARSSERFFALALATALGFVVTTPAQLHAATLYTAALSANKIADIDAGFTTGALPSAQLVTMHAANPLLGRAVATLDTDANQTTQSNGRGTQKNRSASDTTSSEHSSRATKNTLSLPEEFIRY